MYFPLENVPQSNNTGAKTCLSTFLIGNRYARIFLIFIIYLQTHFKILLIPDVGADREMKYLTNNILTFELISPSRHSLYAHLVVQQASASYYFGVGEADLCLDTVIATFLKIYTNIKILILWL